MKGGEKGVSMLHDNVHDSTGGWDVKGAIIRGRNTTWMSNDAPLDIQVVFRPLMTLRQLLVHPKDRVPMDERKEVVYSIPYTVCPRVYIGQMGRSLKLRLKEHQH